MTTTQSDEHCRQEAAHQAAMALRDLLDELTGRGLPLEAIMAGVHAEIVSTMVCVWGGPATIARMVNAADRIDGLPSALQVRLMAAQPAGRA
ncbi:hypothetical protein [Roseovarius autotrophicus]|uniref:hypothetical protein n=1 Tax=Roseovarius autotrophicus TaxID=2824121 RepID=UPI001B37CB2E|nr:hypothetical protein [Roseovarius autotrophicus]